MAYARVYGAYLLVVDINTMDTRAYESLSSVICRTLTFFKKRAAYFTATFIFLPIFTICDTEISHFAVN